MQCVYTIFASVPCLTLLYLSTLFHKCLDFWKKINEHEMGVLIFVTSFIWNMSHSKKNWVSCGHKCILGFIWSTRYSCQILVELGFSRQSLEKYSIKFHENPSGENRSPCGRTVTRTVGQTLRSYIVAFPNFANGSKKDKLFPLLKAACSNRDM